jgi:hypothetical protein
MDTIPAHRPPPARPGATGNVSKGGSVAMMRMTARTAACALGACLLLAGSPAAQNADPFRSEGPMPASPAPRPQPQPRLPAEPEPALVAPPVAAAPAPPPMPQMPPASQVWARVRQVAQAAGIDVPLASDPAFDMPGTSPRFQALLGAWGPGVWQGTPGGDKLMMIVQNAGSDGNLHGIMGRSSGMGWTNYTAAMAGNRFVVHVQTSYYASGFAPGARTLDDEDWQFELRPDGRIYGSRKANASSIVLPRLQ